MTPSTDNYATGSAAVSVAGPVLEAGTAARGSAARARAVPIPAGGASPGRALSDAERELVRLIARQAWEQYKRAAERGADDV